MKIKFMKRFLFIWGLLLSLYSSGQSLHDSLSINKPINPDKLVLYCGEGFVVKILDKADKLFQKEYKIKYDVTGCTPALPIETMVSLNRETAKFLDKKYGLSWRSKLRDDVFGLTK